MTTPLFEDISKQGHLRDELGPGTAILRGFARNNEAVLIDSLFRIAGESPFRHMMTPGGYRMSVAMTNCGFLGWITDRRGYRYDAIDPETKAPWPAMPAPFMDLAQRAAVAAGFSEFVPDACLINRYEAGARLTLHQDKNEVDFGQPIVSVSLGLPAVFQFGGTTRSDRTTRISVVHGDVLVWGCQARLRYHGVLPLKSGVHPLVGRYRFNLTMRKAG